MNKIIRQEPDFIVGANGHAGLSNRKTAELLKVDEKAIRNLLKGSADIFAIEEAKVIARQGFQGADLLRLTRYYEKNNRVSKETRQHCSRLIDQTAAKGFQDFVDTMAGIQKQSQSVPKTTQPINTLNATKLLDELKHSLQILQEQLESGHALLKAGNGMVRSLHNAMHNQGGSLNQAERFLKKAKNQIEQMENAIATLESNSLLLEQTTTTRTVILRPKDNRKRIEEFLDELENMSASERIALLNTLPLSEQEQRHGRWSSRLIARYLGLIPHQSRTVLTIMQERGWSR